MAYIGVSPSNGVRRVHTYTATASQTTFSGAGAEGTSLSYKDSNFVDVYQNGIKLGDADYTSTSGTSIVLAQGASVDDLVVVVVFDVFSVADTVSKADGGTFDGAVALAGGVSGNIANVSGDMTLDVAGDITLDADGGDVKLSDGGTVYGELTNSSSYLVIKNPIQDQDIEIKGNDGGSEITAVRFDMSDAGTAVFNHDIKIADNNNIQLGAGVDLMLSSDGTNGKIANLESNGDIIFEGNDGGSTVEAARFDMSAGGRLQLGGTNYLKNGDLQVTDGAVFRSTDYYNSTAVIVAYSASDTSGGIYVDFLNSSGTRIGAIKRNGTSAVSYNTSSDYRLKENVSYDFDATTRLKQLKPCRFNWISDETNTLIDGFIAHEVSSIVPEAISGEKDALEVWKSGEELPDGVSVGDNKLDENGKTIINPQGIDQAKLVPLLVKTIQELEARITALESK